MKVFFRSRSGRGLNFLDLVLVSTSSRVSGPGSFLENCDLVLQIFVSCTSLVFPHFCSDRAYASHRAYASYLDVSLIVHINRKMWACKQALFRSSLPHPRSDHAYASYDVGDGCDMPYLVPGVDLLSER